MNIDGIAIIAQETVLLILLTTAFVKSLIVRRKKQNGGAHAEVIRGEKSMGKIHTWFAIPAVLFTLTVEVADAFIGYKALIVLLNYIVLFLLFFRSSWFRNQVLFPSITKFEKD